MLNTCCLAERVSVMAAYLTCPRQFVRQLCSWATPRSGNICRSLWHAFGIGKRALGQCAVHGDEVMAVQVTDWVDRAQVYYSLGQSLSSTAAGCIKPTSVP